MWDTKYRPLKFADVLGQEGNVQLLKSRLRNGTAFDTSYIFAGGFGRGKTTLSRIHARAMLCLNLDKSNPEPCNECSNCLDILNEQPGAFSERDSASQGTIEHLRSIVEELPYVIANAPKRIYLFDEAHRMGVGAQDVLLKPVEEKRMVAFFCTTEAEKIRGTIRSRCEEYTIRKITREDILKRMQMVLATESVEYTDDAVLIVIDHSGGHVRDVLNKLEMISQLGPITVESVREYLRLTVVTLYYEILLSLDNPVRAIELVDQACDQAAPEDVSAGIAEAAMNSFRISNGMAADFAYVDKTLAEQVYAKYKANVIRFAQWFLGSRYTTKLSLTRDVVLFSQTSGNLPIEGPTPPVVFAASGVVAAPATALAIAPTQSAAPMVQTAATPAPKPKDFASFADPTALTATESQVVNGRPMPRSRNRQDAPPPTRGSGAKAMTPEEWRGHFEHLYRKKDMSTVPH
jgi:DNA polymerase III subunit gamma/tau